uniref:HTH La-type RNA-binding domain-containing protein n=1 Tax=Meloidogyne javanica TaxID=6303 RepID=A0A915N5Q7_MELJA
MYLFISVNDLDGAIKEVQQSEENEEKIPETLSAPGQHHYQSNNNCNSSNASPFLPMLPWWFTAECRHQLLSVPGPEQFIRSNTPEQRPPSSICGAIPMNEEQLRARLTKQLEFYFSRENLINDRYLRCQMDADQYVPIKIVANFPKVAQLSTDFDLIVNVLKSSSQVQVDESGTKVRPMSKRCTIILREIPQNADENEVKSMFQSEDGQCPPYLSLAYGLNDSWYVTFQTEEETQQAFFHLQTLGKTFNGKPVFARIKNGGAPIGADHRHSPDVHQQLLRFSENGLHGQLIIHDLDIERSTTPNSQQHLRPCERGGGGGDTTFCNLVFTEVEKSTEVKDNKATFRPNIPPPTSSVLPPLQPTTTGIGTLLNGLPQPTSYFTQPILRNATSIEQQMPKSLLNSYGLRHSEGPPPQQQSSLSSTCNIQQLCPLSEATISLNWRQHEAANTNKPTKQQQKLSATIVPPFRGAQNTNLYKPRTWSTSNSDWLNKQQKLGNNEGGQWQGVGRNAGIKRQQQQRWIDTEGIGIKGGSTSSKTVMRRSGSEYNGRPPFASSNRSTRPTSIRFPEGNNMSAEKEFGVVVDQHNFSNLKGLNKIDEQKARNLPADGVPKILGSAFSSHPVGLKGPEPYDTYNFEEHVEEFPALSLSQTNSRKASECHSEQPSPSSPKLLLDQQQQQASLFSIKQPFSVVVAGGGNGGRPRRATIGTSTATCTTICGDSRKMNNNENICPS